MFGWFRSNKGPDGGGVVNEMAVRARRVLDDLHTLEINTIQNDAMTARRMPPLPTAIAEIGELYADWLTRTLMERQEGLFNRRNRSDQFKQLRDEAAKLIHSDALTPAEQVIASRIHRNSIALKTLCKQGEANAASDRYFTDMTLDDLYGTPDRELEAAWRPTLEDRAKVRKIWEVRTELVLMQSMIQLEGDVVTRFSPLLFESRDAQVIGIHQQAIKTSTRMWSVLFGAVGALAGLQIGSPKPDS